jgi:hypothetical protein
VAGQASLAAAALFDVPEATSTPPAALARDSAQEGVAQGGDIPPQPHLAVKPQRVKAMYATAWTAGSKKRMNEVIELIDETELNAVVIDVKDYSGFLSYATGIPEFQESGAEEEIRILRPNALLKSLHDRGIYAIARITVFQDPVLAKAHPEWALKDSEGALWSDRKGLFWLDPSVQEVWDYHLKLAKDAYRRGFDEINLDYIRFPSDGRVTDIRYPQFREDVPKQDVIGAFLAYLRKHMEGVPLSIDIFGLVTVDTGDVGIGQHLEVMLPYVDYVMPMVYPSHYAQGFIGYKNPAAYPYEVVQYSLDRALARMAAYREIQSTPAASSTTTSSERFAISDLPFARLRPWLQDFDLGADYDAEMVKEEIRAVAEAAEKYPELVEGWALWSPGNTYTRGALTGETAP